MTNESPTTNPSDGNWWRKAPAGMFYVSSYTRPELCYGVDPKDGSIFCSSWSHYDDDGNAYPDDLMATTRLQLTEYDKMKIAATPRNDDTVTEWFLNNAKRHGHSLDMIVPMLLDWFGPASVEVVA